MSDERNENVDFQNRKIEQNARSDTDLETVVPPTSPMGGMTTWWRAGMALVGAVVIIYVIVQAF